MPKQHYHSHRSQSSSGPSSLSSAKSTARTAQSPGSTSTICFDATVLSAKDQIHEISARTTRKEEEEIVLKRKLVPRLAKRAYHLEDGNTWFQDWAQYQKNTHPVFGLCMYHRLHPIRFPQRFIILVGSIAFGFAITNVVYLGFLKDENAGDAVNAVYDVTGKAAEFQQRYTKIELQQSMLFLITVGSFLHSMFDMLIWYLMACFCFRHGGIKVSSHRFYSADSYVHFSSICAIRIPTLSHFSGQQTLSNLWHLCGGADRHGCGGRVNVRGGYETE